MFNSYSFGDMTIANGASDSNTVTSDYYKFAREFVFQVPATLTVTITLLASLDGGVTYATVSQDDGTPIPFAAGTVQRVPYQGWDSMKLHSSGAVGAARVFTARAIEDV